MPYTYQDLHADPALWDGLKGEIELVCEHCGTTFRRTKSFIWAAVKRSGTTFCSMRCKGLADTQGITDCICAQCGITFGRKRADITRNSKKCKSLRIFCSQSCAATYNNLHKKHGTRRSKLEIWLEEQLRKRYPDSEILFNAKETIGSELDILFPNLELAFEFNGIFHYEPIYGSEKLTSIQNNDHRKILACAEKSIELCVIDVSWITYFKPTHGQKILDILISIVDAKIQRKVAESNG